FGDLLARPDQHLLAVAPVELRPDANLVRNRILAHLLVESAHRDLLRGHMGLARVSRPNPVALGVARDLLAFHDVVAALDCGLQLGVQRVRDLELLLGGHAHLARAFLADDLELAVDLGDDGLALRDASLEKLLHARQALGDVHSGHAAGVERTHGELSARLADRLRGDHADRLADLDDLAGGQVAAVAGAADALPGLADQDRAPLDPPPAPGPPKTRMERTLTATPASMICRAFSSVIEVPLATSTLPPTVMSSAATRPAIFSKMGSLRARSAVMSRTQIPLAVPQSSSRTITSCATSTRRRVR